MAEVTVIAGDIKTSWEVSEPDGINLVGIFHTVIKGSTPITTKLDQAHRIEVVIEELKNQQHAVCAYGTREGDGKTCDCKYTDRMLLGESFEFRGERTGCCELRAAIQILEKMR